MGRLNYIYGKVQKKPNQAYLDLYTTIFNFIRHSDRKSKLSFYQKILSQLNNKTLINSIQANVFNLTTAAINKFSKEEKDLYLGMPNSKEILKYLSGKKEIDQYILLNKALAKPLEQCKIKEDLRINLCSMLTSELKKYTEKAFKRKEVTHNGTRYRLHTAPILNKNRLSACYSILIKNKPIKPKSYNGKKGWFIHTEKTPELKPYIIKRSKIKQFRIKQLRIKRIRKLQLICGFFSHYIHLEITQS